MNLISREKIKELMDTNANFLLVDVMTPDSNLLSHIPGSVSIPVTSMDFERRINELAPQKNKIIILYCSAPICEAAYEAYNMITEMQYTEVFVYEGGLNDWLEAGYQTI